MLPNIPKSEYTLEQLDELLGMLCENKYFMLTLMDKAKAESQFRKAAFYAVFIKIMDRRIKEVDDLIDKMVERGPVEA